MTVNNNYAAALLGILEEAFKQNEEKINTCVDKVVDNIMNDHIIHVFGTGHSHMTGIEVFARAGGLANVNAILDPDQLTMFGTNRSGQVERLPGLADIIFDNYDINKDDIMIIVSNSGRNAVPIEMAMRCRKEGIFTICITSLKASEKMTSRHPSGKKLYELCDVVLDNCTPDGDGCLNVGGIVTGPVSTISSMYLADTIMTTAIEKCVEKGFKPYVYQSQNVDGADNNAAHNKYKGRIKHL
ncbi:MAG: SIS domain-containing protein [Erysipelotrichaceae bacterium]|nr:SIS domain-containing protein [Erysipelotrichaceae bacterium]